MPIYLCTCGTSAAKKFFGQPIPFNAAWVAEQGGIEPAAERIHQSFKDASMADETALEVNWVQAHTSSNSRAC